MSGPEPVGPRPPPASGGWSELPNWTPGLLGDSGQDVGRGSGIPFTAHQAGERTEKRDRVTPEALVPDVLPPSWARDPTRTPAFSGAGARGGQRSAPGLV